MQVCLGWRSSSLALLSGKQLISSGSTTMRPYSHSTAGMLTFSLVIHPRAHACHQPSGAPPICALRVDSVSCVSLKLRLTGPFWNIGHRFGPHLQRVEEFDPGAFGLSAREADLMDPQQRRLLLVAVSALEAAAQVIALAFPGSNLTAA